MKIKVCFFTGSRADYGLLFPLIKKMSRQRDFSTSVFVSGTHWSPEFGNTYKEIMGDGIKITEKLKLPLSGDSPVSIANATGFGLASYAKMLDKSRPDWIIILGDRYEAFAMAIAAHLLMIPIAHISGGEVTMGATDDAIRHSITKMATLHFPSTEVYRKRIVQLGELPERVFNVGALGLDNIRQSKLLSKKKLESELDFSLDGNLVLVTYHPVTLEKNTSVRELKNLLSALDQFPDVKVIITYPNADADGRKLINMINGVQ